MSIGGGRSCMSTCLGRGSVTARRAGTGTRMGGAIRKMSEYQTKAGNLECMNVLNNFCFHVYAQMSLF